MGDIDRLEASADGPKVAAGPGLGDLRIVVLVQGHSKGLQTVKYRAAFEALKRRIPQLELWDIDVAGWRRAACLFRTFRPGRALWRETFYSHPVTFDAYGKVFARRLAVQTRPVDAFLMFGVKFDAPRHAGATPVVAYTDYATILTARLARRFRHPLSPALSRQRVARERDAMAGMEAVCSRSHFVAETIAQEYAIPAHRLTVVGGGSNLPATVHRPAAKGPDDPFRFLFVGKAFRRKGGDRVLAAFQKLRQTQPDAELVMVTRGAPQDVPAGVTILDDPAPETYLDLFRSSQAFVLASRFETWGDVLIEAMANGLPSICPDMRPLDEIVQNGVNGLLFSPDDPDSLLRAMQRLCSDPDLRSTMSANASNLARTRFNWDSVADSLVTVLGSAIEARRKPGRP